MSDGEDDFMCEDEEDYGLEYSEDSNSEPDVDLENQYYNSKALKEDEPESALTSFQRVLDLEGGEKGEWGFKALKQMIKINFKLSNFKEMMVRYKQLLTYIKSAVTRNHSEKSINSILDYISTSKNMELLQDFYETTLEALKDAKNDRLWFKTNTKLGKLYYDRKDYNKLAKILKQLHQSCQTDDGEDDLKKGTQLLEIYALEIQILHIKSAIPHPLIMGVIRECGGKMHLREGEFEKAHTDFFEAFKNYDESGSPRRTTCLKYLVLANMLMKSGINPFDSQEAKPYKNDSEILAMTNLVNSYQTNDINEFELILKQNRQNIMDDPFIREHIEDLLRNIRTQVLIKLINPYTRIYIPHISTELNIDVTEVENLLVSCILDSTIHGRIDQVNQVLLLDRTSVKTKETMSILDKDYLPWVKLSNERLENELRAQQEFVPAGRAHYPLQLNSQKNVRTVTNHIENIKKFIPGKVFYPLNINSSLTKYQQKICLQVLQMYRSERNVNNLTSIEQFNLATYKRLQNVIQKEHATFLDYVRKDWEKNSHRLENMKNHLFYYIRALWEQNVKKVASYPQLYEPHTTICLAYEDPDNHIKVSIQESVFNAGNPRTAIFPTLISKCVLNFLSLESVDDYLLNSHVPVSRDGNVTEMLQKHEIDVVISMSAIKRLMDNNSVPNSVWNIPVVIKKCKAPSPNRGEHLKKIVFIDKVLPVQSPTKFELSEKCHKILIRRNFCRDFSGGFEETENNEPSTSNAQNVAYNIWNIAFNHEENLLLKTKKQNRKITFLLRQKIDGYEVSSDENKRPVIFLPKIENQIEHGAGIATRSELIRQWADLFFRPYSQLYRTRLQGNTSEVIDVESVSLQQINTEAMQHHHYKPHERLGTLFTVFTNLMDLECGNYMIHHDNRTGAFAEVLKECTDSARDIKLDLTKVYDPQKCCVRGSKSIPWCPIDVNYILPQHSVYKRMPGMFKPLLGSQNNKKGK
ncbi:hypothetical protein FQR65_LT02676 [Abscondita terminalis]|nr:hypothetical protein FQR65_LT02676 [Abscondita terminalis]